MNRRGLVLSVLAVGAAGVGGAAWYATRPQPMAEAVPVAPEGNDVLIRPYSPILGPETAPVTIVEFFDPACEACRAFYPVVKEIMAEHGDAIRVVIRYTAFHGDASVEAIRVLEAARMQDVFEPVLEAVLREQPRWASHGTPAPGLILAIAASGGLDVDAARTQMRAPGVVAAGQEERARVGGVGGGPRGAPPGLAGVRVSVCLSLPHRCPLALRDSTGVVGQSVWWLPCTSPVLPCPAPATT